MLFIVVMKNQYLCLQLGSDLCSLKLLPHDYNIVPFIGVQSLGVRVAIIRSAKNT